MGLTQTLVGKKFGYLKVLKTIGRNKHNKEIYKCLCTFCNLKVNVLRNNLISRNIRRCARCKNIPNLIGNRFGKLTVLGFKHFRKVYKTNTVSIWNCLCDCGNYNESYTHSLIRGNKKSCGKCISLEEAATRAIYSKYKSHAKTDKKTFNIPLEQFTKLIKSDCVYCKNKPRNIQKVKRKNKRDFKYYYNGLDRVNSNIGYKIDNVVPACYSCNIAKNDMTLKEFKLWIKTVYDNLF